MTENLPAKLELREKLASNPERDHEFKMYTLYHN